MNPDNGCASDLITDLLLEKVKLEEGVQS
jgi:hypothetical protein